MYKIEPFFNDRMIVLTISDEFNAQDATALARDSYRIADKMNGLFGVVTDMRDIKKISDDARNIVTENIIELKKRGMKVSARVFTDRNDQSIRAWQEISTKAIYTANYFHDKDKAIEFIKDSIRKML